MIVRNMFIVNIEPCEMGLKKRLLCSRLYLRNFFFAKESLKASRASAIELQKTIEQEQQLHREQIKSLNGELERVTKELQEKESTLKN